MIRGMVVLLVFSVTTCQTPTTTTSSIMKKPCQHDDKNFRCVQYIKNYDADTVTFNIPSIHPLLGINISVRLRGIDTPEIRTKDACERALAQRAKHVVKELLIRAKRVDLQNIERGKYFRIVADIIYDGKSLAEYLLKNKFGYRYGGGKKQKPNWCTFKP